MADRDFDERLGLWLREGPDEAPRWAVTAAVAHAQAHPRRSHGLLGPRRAAAALPSIGLARSRRPIAVVTCAGIAVAAAVAVVALSSLLVGPSRPPTAPENPAIAPITSAAPQGTGTPSPSLLVLSDLTGTWSGTVTEPAPVDPTTNYQRDPSKDTAWSMTLDLRACGRAGSCGTLVKTTLDLGGAGKTLDCSANLAFGGRTEGDATITFDEKGAAAGCDVARIAVTPSADGASVTIEETSTGNTLDSGTLDHVATGTAPSATMDPATHATLAALAGKWTGLVTVTTGTTTDATSGVPRETTITIADSCELGTVCGSRGAQIQPWPSMTLSCEFELVVRGSDRASSALILDAMPTGALGSQCGPSRLIVSPPASDGTIVVEQIEGSIHGEGVLTRVPATPPTPAPGATTDPAAAAVASITGAWTGTILLPPTAIDPLSHVPYQTDQAVTFDVTVDLRTCAVGVRCGTLHKQVAIWPPTGQSLACEFYLTFDGFSQGSIALSFGESVDPQHPKECTLARMTATPSTDGQTLTVEESDPSGTFDRGTLTRSAATHGP